MRCVVQRVLSASVEAGEQSSEIRKGLCVLVGITHTDSEKDIKWAANKLLNLKIFSSSYGHEADYDEMSSEKRNWAHSLLEIEGELLLISQFTLYHVSKGRRLDFHKACEHSRAKEIFQQLVGECRKSLGERVQCGFFGEHMKVSLTNDGPVTLVLESPIPSESP